ncbi:DUF222 domain-containing protein [Geodermatophilus sp. URMC 62]|uniref:DUF222 domain-containing protein n=1 Tax=Geodermatophilus sp. URMC 62 TaxID=3423414 RepID=UPI00406C82BF
MDDVRTSVLEPPVALSPGPLGAVQAAWREIGRQTALQARAVAAFAAARPASVDRAQGTPGAMSPQRWAGRAEVLRPVSEWATQELVVALAISEQAAAALLERSLTLVHRLPSALAALETGVLHPGHLGPLLDKVAPIGDDGLRAAVEAELLAWAAGRAVTTPAQLGDRARRLVLARDARAAADRLARAVRQRDIDLRPDRTDGMSVVSALLTSPEACALVAALGACADALPADPADIRTRGQKMADCLLDLVLRPGESGLPPVQVVLTVVAPVGALLGGDAACEIDGQVVPAEVVRALLTALTGQPLISTDATPANATTTESSPEATPTDVTPDRTTDGEVHMAGAALSLAEEEDFRRWSEEFERRLLAGEVDPDPDDAVPEEELLRWLARTGPPPDQQGPGDVAADLDPPDPQPDRALHANPSAADQGSSGADSGEGGWWARADRAVEHAGAALLAAQQAIGHARRTVATAQRADTADETAWGRSPAGQVTAATDALGALTAASHAHRQTLAALLDRTTGGGLADRPRIAVVDALTGALLALTDLPDLRATARAGTGLHTPAPTDGHRPAAALDRYVRARDRRCRFPGCRRRVPRGGELDHTVPWPAGGTSAANLTGYCTGHHRGKHQAPGWSHHQAPDGTLTVTTPTGLTATTEPPPY